ncbi:MAG: hypothetical protein ACE5DI_01365 [Candidatus Micrarchaeia archaeon]
MRLAFIDCASNSIDPFEAFVQIARENAPNVQADRLTAPDILKVPVLAKKMLNAGNDTAIVFLICGEEEWAELDLIHEKIIDVEISTEKFVFFSIISPEEYGKSKEQLEKLTEQKLKTALTLANSMTSAPSQVSSAIGNEEMADAFAALAGLSAAATQNTQETQSTASSSTPPDEEDIRSLF